MGKRGHSEEEILRVLREAESGDTVVEICRKHWISAATFYQWKQRFGGMDVAEAQRLKQLEDRCFTLLATVVGFQTHGINSAKGV